MIVSLLAIILIDSIGYSIIIPVLAPLLQANPPLMLTQASDAFRYFFYGAVMAAYELVMLVAAPVLGQASDRLGRRPVLLVSAAGIAGSYALLAWGVQAGWPAVLLAGRILGGATAGGQGVASAAVLDLSSARNKSLLLNMCLFASSGGFVLGPALGGLLLRTSPSAPLWTMAALGLAALLLLTSFRDPNPPKKDVPLDPGESFRGFAEAFRDSGVRWLFGVFCLHQLSWGAYFLYAPLFGLERFNLSDGQVAHFLALLGVGYLLAYGLANPLLARWLGNAVTAGLGLAATLGLMIATPVFSRAGFLVPLPLLIGTAVSVAYGAIVNLISDRVSPARQGWAMGIAISATALATGTSGLIAGWLSGLDYRYPLYFSVAGMAASGLTYLLRNSL